MEKRKNIPEKQRQWTIKVTQEQQFAINDEVQKLTKERKKPATQSEWVEQALRCYREMRILHSGPSPRRKFDPLHARWHTLLEEILNSGLPHYAGAIIANLKGWGAAARVQGAKISDFGDADEPPAPSTTGTGGG